VGKRVLPDGGARGRDAGAKDIVLLYDTFPGGAGHCFELFVLGRRWLEEARKILRGSPSHNSTCRRACSECLLDFGVNLTRTFWIARARSIFSTPF